MKKMVCIQYVCIGTAHKKNGFSISAHLQEVLQGRVNPIFIILIYFDIIDFCFHTVMVPLQIQ